jgi:hypothetical protein
MEAAKHVPAVTVAVAAVVPVPVITNQLSKQKMTEINRSFFV